MDERPIPSAQPTSTTAAILRAAELEAQLALERTENARRLREVEPRIQEFRATLQSMHQKLRRASEERAELEQRIATRDAEIGSLRDALEAAQVAGAAHPSASAKDEIRRLTERLAELEADAAAPVPGEAGAEIERLRSEIRRRDQALMTATEKQKLQEREIASLDRKLGFARSKIAETRDALLAAKRVAGEGRGAETSRADHATGAPPRASAREERFPVVPGLRFEASTGPTGLGSRFLAREAQGRRPVGVIVLARPFSETDLARLEAMKLAQHGNLASVVAFGMSPAGPYVAFERAFGETAGEWVRRIGALPERTALPLALQIARGLRHAAFHGVLHGDLSPGTVRIEPTGRARVEDVGLGALHGDRERPILAPLFAAPERLRGGACDVRSDIYSLGGILFFLLTGRAPFEGDRVQLARRGATPEAPDPRDRCPGLSLDTSKFVTRLIAREPERRPATWDEVLLNLERMVGGRTDEPSGARGRIAQFVAAHPLAASCVAAAPVLAAALYLHLATGRVPSPRERFDTAVRKADLLADGGDVEGARLVLARFLGDTGDAAVEREAAKRLDALRAK